jgi:hypothetical protein
MVIREITAKVIAMLRKTIKAMGTIKETAKANNYIP